jgi:hypothetical protein
VSYQGVLKMNEFAHDTRTLLQKFYTLHNPEKLELVDTICQQYAGSEMDLVKHLLQKYNKTLDDVDLLMPGNTITSTLNAAASATRKTKKSKKKKSTQQPSSELFVESENKETIIVSAPAFIAAPVAEPMVQQKQVQEQEQEQVQVTSPMQVQVHTISPSDSPPCSPVEVAVAVAVAVEAPVSETSVPPSTSMEASVDEKQASAINEWNHHNENENENENEYFTPNRNMTRRLNQKSTHSQQVLHEMLSATSETSLQAAGSPGRLAAMSMSISTSDVHLFEHRQVMMRAAKPGNTISPTHLHRSATAIIKHLERNNCELYDDRIDLLKRIYYLEEEMKVLINNHTNDDIDIAALGTAAGAAEAEAAIMGAFSIKGSSDNLANSSSSSNYLRAQREAAETETEVEVKAESQRQINRELHMANASVQKLTERLVETEHGSECLKKDMLALNKQLHESSIRETTLQSQLMTMESSNNNNTNVNVHIASNGDTEEMENANIDDIPIATSSLLQLQINNLEKQNQELLSKNSNLERNYEISQKDVLKLKKELDLDLDSDTNSILQIDQKNMYEFQINDYKNVINALKQQLDTELVAHHDELEKAKVFEKELQVQVAEHEVRCSSVISEFQTYKAEAEQHLETVYLSHESTLDNKLVELRIKNELHVKEVREKLENQVTAAETAVQAAQDALKIHKLSSEAKLSENDSTIVSLTQELEASKMEKSALLESHASENSSNIDSLMKQMASRQESIENKYKVKLNEKDNNFDLLTQQFDALQIEKDVLLETQVSMYDIQEKLQNEFQSFQKAAKIQEASLQKQISEKTYEINEFLQKLQIHRDTEDKKEKTLHTQINEKDNHIHELTSQITDMRKVLIENVNNIELLTQRLKAQQDESTAIAALDTKIESDINKQAEETLKMVNEESLSLTIEKIRSLTFEIHNHELEIKKKDNIIFNIKNDFKEYKIDTEEELNILQDELDTNNIKIETLEQRLQESSDVRDEMQIQIANAMDYEQELQLKLNESKDTNSALKLKLLKSIEKEKNITLRLKEKNIINDDILKLQIKYDNVKLQHHATTSRLQRLSESYRQQSSQLRFLSMRAYNNINFDHTHKQENAHAHAETSEFHNNGNESDIDIDSDSDSDSSLDCGLEFEIEELIPEDHKKLLFPEVNELADMLMSIDSKKYYEEYGENYFQSQLVTDIIANNEINDNNIEKRKKENIVKNAKKGWAVLRSIATGAEVADDGDEDKDDNINDNDSDDDDVVHKDTVSTSASATVSKLEFERKMSVLANAIDILHTSYIASRLELRHALQEKTIADERIYEQQDEISKLRLQIDTLNNINISNDLHSQLLLTTKLLEKNDNKLIIYENDIQNLNNIINNNNNEIKLLNETKNDLIIVYKKQIYEINEDCKMQLLMLENIFNNNKQILLKQIANDNIERDNLYKLKSKSNINEIIVLKKHLNKILLSDKEKKNEIDFLQMQLIQAAEYIDELTSRNLRQGKAKNGIDNI